MRTVKTHDEREKEILDIAEKLFLEKGYSGVTVNDMIAAANIAKGTFYYYFKSKEEVMDGVVERFMRWEIGELGKIVAGEADAADKLRRMIGRSSHGDAKYENFVRLYFAQNPEMHFKNLTLTLRLLTPLVAKVIEQGVREGIYTTPYPLEAAEILMISSKFMFDEGIFELSDLETLEKLRKFAKIMERMLGAASGSFDYIYDTLSCFYQNYEEQK